MRVLEPRTWSRFRTLLELMALSLASATAVLASGSVRADSGSRWISAAFPLVVVAMLRIRHPQEPRLSNSVVDLVAQALAAVSISAMLMIAISSILGAEHSVSLALRLWLFAVVYLGIARAVLLSVHRHLNRSPTFATPTLVVGAGLIGERLVERLLGEPRYGLRPVGFIDANPLGRTFGSAHPPIPVVGALEDLAQAVTRTGVRHVILAFSSYPDHVLVEKVRECQDLGVQVSLVPRLYESINAHATLDHVSGLPLLTLHPTDPRGAKFALKHAIDRSVALLALIGLAPVMLAIAAGVKLTSPGPVLFRQRRVGRDRRIFDVLKFRTMRANVDSQAFALPDDCAPGGVEGIDRRTRFGQWLRRASLDELPQFINVLLGDMSLVGPRPERPEFVEVFTDSVERYDQRHRVKSGITGWAQVNGLRGQTSIRARVEWDNYYIQNWSLSLDLRIIALTVAEIFRFRG